MVIGIDSIKCFHCKKEITGRHIVYENLHFCNDDCADGDWRERGADLYAREMSDGLFSNYEDYMESLGVTVLSHYEEDQPSYLRNRER